MASENIRDWNLPLSTPENLSESTDDDLTLEQRRHKQNLERLATYVESMAYKPNDPVKASPYTESLAKPKKRTIIHNAKQFPDVMMPSERGKRLKLLAAEYNTISLEQLEKLIRSTKAKERENEKILKRKEYIYYELLTKLQLQSKAQYLDIISGKFAHFISKLSTTMPVPKTLFDPYARIQRGLFCNILQSIGVGNPNQLAIYYNSNMGSEYSVVHKMSHALLSLIIKALDSASTRRPNMDVSHSDKDDKIDDCITERLMCAVQKKILKSKCGKTKIN